MNVYAYWRLTADAERPPIAGSRNPNNRTYAVRMTDAGDITGVAGPLPNGTDERWPNILPSYPYDEHDPYQTKLDYVITHSGDFRQVGKQVQT